MELKKVQNSITTQVSTDKVDGIRYEGYHEVVDGVLRSFELVVVEDRTENVNTPEGVQSVTNEVRVGDIKFINSAVASENHLVILKQYIAFLNGIIEDVENSHNKLEED